MEKLTPSKRPKSYPSTTTKYKTGCGNIYVLISVDDNGEPVEMFASMGKAGGCSMAMLEAVGKSVSVGLRCGIDPMEYVEKLMGVRCLSPTWEDGELILSCVDAMGRALKAAVDKYNAKAEA